MQTMIKKTNLLHKIIFFTHYMGDGLSKLKLYLKQWIASLFFSKEKTERKAKLETVIIVDMDKIDFIDLAEVLAPYEKKSKVFLAGKEMSIFDKKRIDDLDYNIEFVPAVKMRVGKFFKNLLKEQRRENKYRVVGIKGRSEIYVNTCQVKMKK